MESERAANPANDALPGDQALAAALRALVRRGLGDAEVMVKRGRSRRLVRDLAGELSAAGQERAWAVRASSRQASFFLAGTGDLPESGAAWDWPAAGGRPFRLPDAAAAPAWSEPADFAAPLVGESEGLRLLAAIESELAAELPGARLLHGALEDGSSETRLASSRGLAVHFRRRLATLRLEAASAGHPAAAASLYLAAREARRFHPKALARRLADCLALQAGAAPSAGAGSAAGAGSGGAASRRARRAAPAGGGAEATILSPAVAAALLAALTPLLVGPGAAALAAPLRDRRGRLGAACLTILDNGRLPGGALECCCDGEGVPCGEVALVEEGAFRQPLLAWWQADGAAAGRASGCSRRAGWRDLPAPGPTHLYVRPEPRTAVASLLAEAGRGAYLVEPLGMARYQPADDRFVLQVCGFSIEAGRAAAPIPRACLSGSAAALLQGVAAVARDLTFFPLDGMIGSPTLLVRGLTLMGAG